MQRTTFSSCLNPWYVSFLGLIDNLTLSAPPGRHARLQVSECEIQEPRFANPPM